MLVQIPQKTFFFFYALIFLRSFTISQSTEAPVTGPPVSMAPVTAAPVDTTPSTSPSEYPLRSDFRCGLDAIDAKNNCGTICQYPTDCAPGLFCFGSWNTCYVQDESVLTAPASPLPRQMQPRSDFRCGVSEVDARSNCKPYCTVNTDCDTGESCWGTHNSYCHIMPENHPQCDYNEAENLELRCGYDEMAARGFCGATCGSETDCVVPGERCFPVHLNLCDCFEEEDGLNAVVQVPPTQNPNLGQNNPLRQLDDAELILRETNRLYFERAKEPLNEYFQNDDSNSFENNSGQMSTSSAKKNQISWFGYIASILLMTSSLMF